MKPKVVIVLGPTAVGKTDTVLELAAEFNGEIISADSQQVYRQMNIGTAKPSPEERKKIPHHLIDIVDPDQEFNAAMFRRLALDSARQIAERGKNVFICGGTGLYIKAFTGGLFEGPEKSLPFREALHSELLHEGLDSLYQRLARVDAAATRWIHPNDRQRIIRALEVYELTGRPMSDWQKEHAFGATPFEMVKIGLNRPRLQLYGQINQRCQRMIDADLIGEVKALREKGYGLNLRPMQSIGYRHAALVIDGQLTLSEAIELMKRDSRRLAKRQLTWYRADKTIRWFDPQQDRREISSAVREFLGKIELGLRRDHDEPPL